MSGKDQRIGVGPSAGNSSRAASAAAVPSVQQADMADTSGDRTRIDARAAGELEKTATARPQFCDFLKSTRAKILGPTEINFRSPTAVDINSKYPIVAGTI
jgi:hypothetical protein